MLMLYSRFNWLFLFFAFVLFAISCKKEENVISATAPDYSDVPTVLLENYVNRIYIDLLGREPLDSEMTLEVSYLRSHKLNASSRDDIALKLMTDTTPHPGDVNYKTAYYHRFYELAKARVLESVTALEIGEQKQPIYDDYMRDSLVGDSAGMQFKRTALRKIDLMVSAEQDYMHAQYDIITFFSRLIDNPIYDVINMNTFNFVNATFDDLFFRFPTKSEFDNGYEMVENNKSVIFLGSPGQNKGDYLRIMTRSPEFFNGLVTWFYISLLNREPSSSEASAGLLELYSSHDVQAFQRKIIKSDEYAHFKALK